MRQTVEPGQSEARFDYSRLGLVHYCTLSLSDIWVTRQECRVGTPYMERNFIDSLPKAKVDQSESSFLQKRHLGYVTGPK